jgi:hypothetical protein
MEWAQTFLIMAIVISSAVYMHQDVKSDELYKEFIAILKGIKK